MRRNTKMILSAAIILLMLAIGVLGALTSRKLTKSKATTTHNTSAVVPSNKEHGPVQVVHLTLYDAGIYPRQLHVPKGLVAITIEDFSGGTAGLIITRVNGNDRAQVAQVRRFANHWRGREEIQLEPGRYEVYTTERPDNRAQLVVEP